MNHTLDHHHLQDPGKPETLVAELFEALNQACQKRAAWTHRHDAKSDRSVAPFWPEHEKHVMFDATVALLIRHRLPIDLEAACAAVTNALHEAGSEAQLTPSDAAHAWARGCAEYIASIARARHSEIAHIAHQHASLQHADSQHQSQNLSSPTAPT